MEFTQRCFSHQNQYLEKLKRVMKWDFSEIFKQCVATEIITLFLLRNRFSIIWNITNYGCQAEAREMNYEPDFYAYTVNGDFQSSAAQRYTHSIWLESRLQERKIWEDIAEQIVWVTSCLISPVLCALCSLSSAIILFISTSSPDWRVIYFLILEK